MRFQALTTLLVLAGALAAPAARAQQPPAGSYGFVGFTAGVPSTTPLDALMAINLNGYPNPFLQVSASNPPSNAVMVNTPLNAGGINLVAARSQQRRGMQAPREAELAPAFDGINLSPAVFIPAEDPLTGLGYVTSVDFRGPFPPTNTTPIPLNGVNGGRGVPYEILRHSSLPLVYYTTTSTSSGFPGNLVVVEVNYSVVNAPVVTATYTLSGPPTRYATRLTDTGNNQIAIPWAGGVDIVSTPGLGFVSTNPTPAGFTVGTNVAKGWKGALGFDLICGLQAATPGLSANGYLAVNSVAGGFLAAPNAFGSVPGGGPWRFSGGFYDIAITRPSGAPGPATATFLLSNPVNMSTFPSQVVTVTQTAPLTTTVHPIPQGATFGNPEVVGSPPGSVVFMVSGATADSVGAIWPSAPGLTTATSVVQMTGLMDPAAADRPLAMPGGIEFCVDTSYANFPSTQFGVEVYSVGLGTLAQASVVNTTSPATGLPNVMTGGLLGNQPVYAAGFTAMDVVVAGFPLAAPPLGITVLTSALTSSNPVTGMILPFPPAPLAQPATFGARQAMFNFANGSPTAPSFLYPGTGFGGGSQIDVVSLPSTQGQWTCPNGFLLTSELFSF